MRAAVKSDQTVRTIVIKIEPGSVPDLDVTRTWQSSRTLIRPNQAVLRVQDGRNQMIVVTGKVILKSGEPSDKSDRRAVFGPIDLDTAAPDWVRTLWTEAGDVRAWATLT